MATHDNLVLIINQLLQGLDRIGDSLSVVKAIGEDVKAMKDEMETIKRRMVKMEERIGDELPTKTEVSAIREMFDEKLKPLDQIRTMDERMLKIEGSISHLRDELPTKTEVSAIREMLDEKLKPLDQIRTMDERMLKIEGSIIHLRSIDSETNTEISDTLKNTERKLLSMEETMNKLMLTMENATQNRSIDSEKNAEISDRVKNTERKLLSIEDTMNKLMLTMENATQNSKVEEKSNYAFDTIFKGEKIELSNDQRTASRLRPHEDRGHFGGVLSNTPLRDDVAFEVRIDETIDQWRNYGIALGVIVKKDEAVKEKKYICYNIPGTYCIWSYYFADNGKSHIYKDDKEISRNAYNLDTRHLPVGTTLGVVRRSNNALHFLLNGIDQGAAFGNIPDHVFAFVDVSDYVSKISILS